MILIDWLIDLDMCHVISVGSADMATLSMKPSLRCTVPDWMKVNNELSVIAEQTKHLSHEIRLEGRALGNDTSNKVIHLKWEWGKINK